MAGDLLTEGTIRPSSRDVEEQKTAGDLDEQCKDYDLFKEMAKNISEKLPRKKRADFLARISSNDQEVADHMHTLMTTGGRIDDATFSAKVAQWFTFSRSKRGQTIDRLTGKLVWAYQKTTGASKKEAWSLIDTIVEEGNSLDDFLNWKTKAEEKLTSLKKEHGPTDGRSPDKGGDGKSETVKDPTELKTQLQFKGKEFPSCISKTPQVFSEEPACPVSDEAVSKSYQSLNSFALGAGDKTVVDAACQSTNAISEGSQVFHENDQSGANANVDPMSGTVVRPHDDPYDGPVTFPPDETVFYPYRVQTSMSRTVNSFGNEDFQEMVSTASGETASTDIEQDSGTHDHGDEGDANAAPEPLDHEVPSISSDEESVEVQAHSPLVSPGFSSAEDDSSGEPSMISDEVSMEVQIHSPLTSLGFLSAGDNILGETSMNLGGSRDSLQSIRLIPPVKAVNEQCRSILATGAADYELVYQKMGQVTILRYIRINSGENCSA